MIGLALNRTWQQLLHPQFRSVFITAILAATATLVLMTLALNHYWPNAFSLPGWLDWGWEWADSVNEWAARFSFWFTAGAGSYLLFPGLVTMVMGLLIDKIATAVEEDYYPNRIGTRKVAVGETVWSAAKLTLLMLLVNLIALIPYVILLIAGGFGFILLFVAVNGFLLGREYFEMVAARHMAPGDVRAFRVENGGKIFFGGALIAAMFMVPILNLFAPIIGASVMTHVFHNLRAQPRSAR
jgi:CysZ protein